MFAAVLQYNDVLNLNASALVLTRNPEACKRKAPHLYRHPAIRFHRVISGATTFIAIIPICCYSHQTILGPSLADDRPAP